MTNKQGHNNVPSQSQYLGKLRGEKRMMRKEALVVCGVEKKAGVTIRDLDTGDLLLRIPTCASPPRGLLCLQNGILVASQLQRDRPFGCGAIFFWPLNKPQSPQISYPMEVIGPIASSKDDIYLVGGTHSGNVYIWEIASGRLLKNWRAHHRPVGCLALSHDDSFLVSGSEDGTVRVWSVISLLNCEDPQAGGSLTSFCNWSEHGSAVTGLLLVSGGSGPALISSSLDGTCKVWDIVSGILLQNHVFSVAVTAVGIDPGEQLLFAGREDGKIYVNVLDLGLQDNQITVSEDESGVLHGHKGPITALAFNLGGSLLISASEDCTACHWDVASWQITRRFTHEKGHITNLIVIPASFLSAKENQRSRLRPQISSLEKTPQLNNARGGTLTLLPGFCSHEDPLLLSSNSRSFSLLSKQILDYENGRTAELIQMKIGSNIENRLWILEMTKQMNSINQHLQSRVVDMMQYRLCGDDHTANARSSRGSKIDDGLQENHEPPT